MGMSFGKYVLYRVVNALILLFLAVLLMSALFTKLATVQLNAQINSEVQQWIRTYQQKSHQAPTQEAIEAYRKSLEHQYGLDKPYWQRAWNYAIDTFTFKWGQSIPPIYGTHNVKDQIKTALANTILLFTTAQILIILIGLSLGIKSARNPGSLLDRTISILAMITTSLPMWWLGMLMILLFVVYLGWLPITLYSQVEVSGWVNLLKKMTLPLVTIVLVSFGGWSWTTRNIMIGTMQEDFIMVARAKGVPERKIIYGHALKAAAPPIITMVIFGMIGSMGGAMITEIVFNWPGMGRLYWMAIGQNAVRTMMALNYMFAVMTVFSMLLADILYAYLDPRIRIGAAASS
ncbi:ABC transporter permease [Thermococcus henrietii]|uniref:ABC transporter permease n=1 Tax=Thermococcus henrietii TaxID=2016361 RepID=UPI002948BEC1|nr:ABC transporter permease [Thermococcus henrietii]